MIAKISLLKPLNYIYHNSHWCLLSLHLITPYSFSIAFRVKIGIDSCAVKIMKVFIVHLLTTLIFSEYVKHGIRNCGIMELPSNLMQQ